MNIAVVDSGGANIASVLHALCRLGAEPEFTADPEKIRAADRVILPGVGAAETAMAKLHDSGLIDVIHDLQQPVLGICLGMQLLFESTEEGDVDMLGLIPARVRRLRRGPGLRVPHMGWANISTTPNFIGCSDIDNTWFYFVHSFAAPVGDWTVATATHGLSFSAAVQAGNFYGVQFHPERSAQAGSRLLSGFLEERPWN